MFGFIFAIVVRARVILRRLMPTNLVLDAIHTRRGLKWGVPAMLIAVPYGLAAVYCVGLIERGAAGWLNLVVVLFVWNGLKFLVAGPVTVIQLLHVRAREARARRLPVAGMLEMDVPAERSDELEFASAGDAGQLSR
ncbi:sulfate permease [Agromyces albus]|uniref:sulfate permease n=1 Tax=Agromyces albus TaxID=205332 RepID=UPI001F527AA5|nr:sulfate permease [Agromyces albus]